MNIFDTLLIVTSWVFQTTLKASILVGLILLSQYLLTYFLLSVLDSRSAALGNTMER